MPATVEAAPIFIVAGEPSGDVLGARLMRAMRDGSPAPLRFVGVGGRLMQAEGLETLFPMSDIAVMGIGEVLPRLPRILRRLNQASAAAAALRPAAVVTIDSSSFNKRLARRLIKASVEAPRIHYVAPMVWAWRPRRAEAMAALFDHLIALLSFEVEPFRKAGLPTTWSGHPVVEAPAADGLAFRRRHGISPEVTTLCVLPGSRSMEVSRLLPIFQETLARLASKRPVHAVIPTVETVEHLIRGTADRWPTAVTIVTGEEEKASAFAASDLALAASGTVTLELAAAQVPMVVAYRAHGLTAFLARRLVDLRHISLVNILSSGEVVPEILQENCTPDRLARELERLISDDSARARQVASFRRLTGCLAPEGGPAPSRRAADIVLSLAFPGTAPQTPASSPEKGDER